MALAGPREPYEGSDASGRSTRFLRRCMAPSAHLGAFRRLLALESAFYLADMAHPSRLLSARSLARASAELALIVLGILVALWIDGCVEARNDAELERHYLVLLSGTWAPRRTFSIGSRPSMSDNGSPHWTRIGFSTSLRTVSNRTGWPPFSAASLNA